MSKTLKRPAPFSLRLTETERAQLTALAGGQPLAAYVKAVLFNGTKPPRTTALADRALLAQLLATLGGSRIAPNLSRLAQLADTGGLADRTLSSQVEQACDDVRLMHNALMRGLGLQEREPSRHELGASAEFNGAARPGGSS